MSRFEGRFKGIVSAVITPMSADGSLAEDAFRQVLAFNVEAGVNGFWLAGGSGESVMLDDDENRQIASIAADQVKGRAVNIMHVGTATTRRSAALAEHAATVGADAICCVPPFFYDRSDEEIVEHYRVVAAAANLPLFAYNLPQCTGVELTPELMKKIQDAVPQLAGLKHSALTFSYAGDFASMGLTCFIGSAALLLPGLTIGAVGCVDGDPGVAPEYFVEAFRLYQGGDLEGAAAAHEKTRGMKQLIRSLGRPYFHAALKLIMSERLGIDCGDPRPPAMPLSDQQRQQIIAGLEALGLAKPEVVA